MYLVWIMLGFLFLYVFRLAKGPSVWDRLLGVNLVSTKVIILVIALASLTGRTFLLDFAIVCTLLGFICIIFIAQFLLDREKPNKDTTEERR